MTSEVSEIRKPRPTGCLVFASIGLLFLGAVIYEVVTFFPVGDPDDYENPIDASEYEIGDPSCRVDSNNELVLESSIRNEGPEPQVYYFTTELTWEMHDDYRERGGFGYGWVVGPVAPGESVKIRDETEQLVGTVPDAFEITGCRVFGVNGGQEGDTAVVPDYDVDYIDPSCELRRRGRSVVFTAEITIDDLPPGEVTYARVTAYTPDGHVVSELLSQTLTLDDVGQYRVSLPLDKPLSGDVFCIAGIS